MSFANFSSLPPEQEATFGVYEERIAKASGAGLMAGLIAGAGLGLVIIIIALTVTPDEPKDYSSDPGSKTQKANTVKADTAEAPTP